VGRRSENGTNSRWNHQLSGRGIDSLWKSGLGGILFGRKKEGGEKTEQGKRRTRGVTFLKRPRGFYFYLQILLFYVLGEYK